MKYENVCAFQSSISDFAAPFLCFILCMCGKIYEITASSTCAELMRRFECACATLFIEKISIDNRETNGIHSLKRMANSKPHGLNKNHSISIAQAETFEI